MNRVSMTFAVFINFHIPGLPQKANCHSKCTALRASGSMGKYRDECTRQSVNICRDYPSISIALFNPSDAHSLATSSWAAESDSRRELNIHECSCVSVKKETHTLLQRAFALMGRQRGREGEGGGWRRSQRAVPALIKDSAALYLQFKPP